MIILALFLQIEYQAVNHLINNNTQELTIYFKIPRENIKFIAEDSNFYASYEIQLKVYDKKNNQITGDFWPIKRLMDTLDIEDSVKLEIPKSSHYYRLRIVDLNGGEILYARADILPINYLGNIRWNVTNDSLHLYFLVHNKKGDLKKIVFLIEDIKEELPVKQGIYKDSLKVFVGNLPIDSYSLKIKLFSDKRKLDELTITVKVERPFYLDDDAWQEKVNQLEYIATYQEIQRLKKAETVKRDSLWQAFWKKHDPTPNTAYNEKRIEYFSRIKYCEEHFSRGDKGWRSDRAKIYVRYGPPDEIERHPYELSTPPYEIWFYYNMNRKFIFVDRYGFGQYILVNSRGSNI